MFAATPDCLFLFFDTSSETLYLLQCSGRFTQILEMYNKCQPVLENHTTWEDLPIIQFTDLASISVFAPRTLSIDEMALPDGLILNLKDLWEGHLNKESTLDRNFQNDCWGSAAR